MVNKDKCYNYEELNEEKLKQFSEGSNSLESLLKYCYKNKIITRACCIGHNNEESENPFPYILFLIDKNQYKLMESVLSKLLINEGIMENTNIEISRENEKILLGIRFKYNQEIIREKFFNLLELLLKQYQMENNNTNVKYNDLFNSFNILYDEKQTDEININYQQLTILKEEDKYFKFVDNKVVESKKEESDFISKSLEKKQIIDNSNIEEYIKDLMKNNSIIK